MRFKTYFLILLSAFLLPVIGSAEVKIRNSVERKVFQAVESTEEYKSMRKAEQASKKTREGQDFFRTKKALEELAFAYKEVKASYERAKKDHQKAEERFIKTKEGQALSQAGTALEQTRQWKAWISIKKDEISNPY